MTDQGQPTHETDIYSWLHHRLKQYEDFFEVCGDVFSSPAGNRVGVHVRYRVGRFRHVVDVVDKTLDDALRAVRQYFVDHPQILEGDTPLETHPSLLDPPTAGAGSADASAQPTFACQGARALSNLYDPDGCEGFAYGTGEESARSGWELVGDLRVCSVCAKKLDAIGEGFLANMGDDR